MGRYERRERRKLRKKWHLGRDGRRERRKVRKKNMVKERKVNEERRKR